MQQLFRVLPGHYTGLQATIEGYQRTGVPLIAFDDPAFGDYQGLGPAGHTQDVGSYIIIPKVVELTGFSLDMSIQLVYGGTIFFAFLAAAIGSWLYCKTAPGKLISIVALALLSFIIAGIWDYYIYLGAAPLAIIPLWLYLQEKGNLKALFIFCGIAGLIIGLGHWMRSHSGTSVLVFIGLSLVFAKQYSKRLKLGCVMVLCLGILVVFMSINSIVKQRNDFLTSIDSPFLGVGDRPMWTNLYSSLGYLNNYYAYDGWPLGQVHENSDSYSAQRVLSINPNVRKSGEEYEAILKNEYFKFIKEHPWFFVNSQFAKFGVLLMYVFMFSNVGLILSVYYHKSYRFVLLFASGIGFNMLFGLAATPEHRYLMGLFVFSTLYGIYSIDHALDQGFLKRLTKSKEKKVHPVN